MIGRILHLVAIGGLIGSAVYAYSIKYETTYHAEQLSKMKTRIQRERDAIAVMRAEWQLLNTPERLQVLASKHLDLAPLQIPQLGTVTELPMRQDKGDEIGRKLEALGVGMPTATPRDARDPLATGSIPVQRQQTTTPGASRGTTPRRP